MNTFQTLPARSVSKDDYSPFYYKFNHFSYPILETPTLKTFTSLRPPPPPRQPKRQPTSNRSVSTGPDPSLELRTYGTCLVIGRSGTGKSTFVKAMVRCLPPTRTLYLVNVRPDEAKEYGQQHPGGRGRVHTLTLSSLDQLSENSSLIIEDIISMKDKEQSVLREAINYTAHHKRCKIFCVTHTVFKTGVFALMPLFHYIVFTSTPANGPIVRQTLQQFCIEKPTIDSVVKGMSNKYRELQAGKKRFDPVTNVFFFDCAQLTIGLYNPNSTAAPARILFSLNSDCSASGSHIDEGTTLVRHDKPDRPSSASLSPASDTFSLFFPTDGGTTNSKALGLYQTIVSSRLARRYLNTATLVFTFPSRTSQKRKAPLRSSLVDYVTTALDPSAVPTAEIKALHRFLVERCSTPRSVVSNKHLLQLQQQDGHLWRRHRQPKHSRPRSPIDNLSTSKGSPGDHKNRCS